MYLREYIFKRGGVEAMLQLVNLRFISFCKWSVVLIVFVLNIFGSLHWVFLQVKLWRKDEWLEGKSKAVKEGKKLLSTEEKYFVFLVHFVPRERLLLSFSL